MQVPTHSSGQPGTLTLTPYIFKTTDDGERVPAEFGRLLVPENRRNPASRLIELAFVRFKCTGACPGPPIIYLAGGPGDPGIESFRHPQGFIWFMTFRAVGDLILLDQRGVGLSNPRLDNPVRRDWPPDQPWSRETYLEMYRDLSHRSATFWREQGVDLTGYTTEENADDVDALREALGVDYINLWGGSYGSHLALAMIKRHGDRVHRAVIPMVEGPDHTIKLPGSIQRNLETIAERVAADPSLSPQVPDLLGLMREVIDRLAAAPVTVEVADPATNQPVNVAVSAFDLKKTTANNLGSIDFIRRLPAYYIAMARGDFTWLATHLLERRRSWFGNAMSFVMDSASGASPERRARIQWEASQTLLEDLVDFPFPYIAEAWAIPDLGSDFRAPVQSNVHALFISGALDGRTPVSNAEEVRAGFPNSHHLIVDGMAHDGRGGLDAPTVTRAMVDFLQGEPVAIEQATVPFDFAPIGD